MSWGNPDNKNERLLADLMWPASVCYGIGSYLRMFAYNKGALKQHKFPVPVISIGNLTVGGTGKTPLTSDIAKRLAEAGYKVGILSRGYKRRSKDQTVVVGDGQGTFATCEESGDEPYMMARTVPEAVVIAGAKRIDSAKLAIDKYACNILLLDDGFQHLAVARAIDVVLIDYNDELLNDRLLPAGRLREPLAALNRADWIVVTKVPNEPDKQRLVEFRSLIKQYAPQAQLTSCRFVPSSIEWLGKLDGKVSKADFTGKKMFAFCAIARPEKFIKDLKALGAQIVGQRNFLDHHWYDHEDMLSLRNMASEVGAEVFITTEKDAIKLNLDMVEGMDIAVLKIKPQWLGPVPVLGTPVKASATT